VLEDVRHDMSHSYTDGFNGNSEWSQILTSKFILISVPLVMSSDMRMRVR